MTGNDQYRHAAPHASELRQVLTPDEAQLLGPGSRGLTILGLAGSLRRDSYNRRLLTAAGRALAPTARLAVFGHLKAIPPFDEDDETTAPEAVVRLRDQIEHADAVLIATPEYNGSVPGQLKNALDWASRPYATNVLRGKPVAVIGASPSPGGTQQANADARRILARIGAQPIDATVIVPRAFVALDAAGTPTGPELQKQLTDLIASLAAAAASTMNPPQLAA